MGATQRTTQRSDARKASKDATLHKVKEAKITKANASITQKRTSFWGLPLLASLFSRNKTSNGDEFEGDTVVNNENQAQDTEKGNDFTLIANGNDYVEEEREEDAHQTLKDYRKNSYDHFHVDEWTSEETWFFTRLRYRGREPLFDHTWFKDFDFFPDRLFTTDPAQVLINNNHCTIYRAIKAMKSLCMAGPLVRGQLTSDAPPEKPLQREITSFYNWTLADAKLQHKKHIPITAIACAKQREPTENVVGRLTDQLHSLSRQWRDKWRRPGSKESDPKQKFVHPMPTLFGIVIKATVTAIVTCDSSVPRKPIRTLHTANWNVVGQDAWHAMAIGIALVRQRDWLMRLDAEGELGPEILDQESDPDA